MIFSPYLSFKQVGKKTKFYSLDEILVLELWGLGDLVLATPALMALRKSFPRAKITLLAKEHAVEVLGGSDVVDEIVTFDFPWTKFHRKYCLWKYNLKGLFQVIAKLRRKKFDLAFCARMDFRNN